MNEHKMMDFQEFIDLSKLLRERQFSIKGQSLGTFREGGISVTSGKINPQWL